MEQNTVESQIGELLRQRSLKLTIAESCTGGLIGHLITNISGSSDYYLGSVTAYAYEAKERLLGVSHATLAKFGAVSPETAQEMARGIRRALAPDFPLESIIGVSVTGIAGPGGGLPNKPVGLVWFGLSTPDGDFTFRFVFSGDRVDVKESAARMALQIVLDYLRRGFTPEPGPQ
jgi:PncC family amidohydrolase